MIYLHAQDPYNHLLLTAYFPPEHGLLPVDQQSLESKDYRLGQALTSMARRRAADWFLREHPDATPAGVPFHSWILSPPAADEGKLAGWFAGLPTDSPYRVLIHRTPARHGKKFFPVTWDEVYEELNEAAGGLCQVSSSAPAWRAGIDVLRDGLKAYQSVPDGVIAWINGLIHPYHYAG